MVKLNKIFNNFIKKIEKNKYSNILVELLINWKIPYFEIIKKYLAYISILSLIIFVNPETYENFWEWGMNLLLIILFTSPLFKIFPKFKILAKILLLRRQIWIIIWAFIFAHIIWYILINNINLFNLISQEITNYKNYIFWWLWWIIFMIFPLITSNNLSQKILKNKWIMIQQFTYLFFIFWSMHIFLVENEIWAILIIFLWIILKILAYKKLVILK